ncbi:hypothetical protein [Burkholderia anthina]|uniref:hypothetical protein n=1 Tax=Burkholderia anthina TaxID=179879 RepID=UPI001AA09820|nr:hypothetical protein [Burkholderia anthina]QTD95057.1 hypothetical protein J4G50_34125 [Burkholderia anthina]
MRVVPRGGRGSSALAARFRGSIVDRSRIVPDRPQIVRAEFDRLSGLRCERAGVTRKARHVPLLHVTPASARQAFEPAGRERVAHARGFVRMQHARRFGAGRARAVAPAGFDGTGNLPTNVSTARPRPFAGQTALRRGTQQIMLPRRLKTVESYRAAAPNRDNPHFGDA